MKINMKTSINTNVNINTNINISTNKKKQDRTNPIASVTLFRPDPDGERVLGWAAVRGVRGVRGLWGGRESFMYV